MNEQAVEDIKSDEPKLSAEQETLPSEASVSAESNDIEAIDNWVDNIRANQIPEISTEPQTTINYGSTSPDVADDIIVSKYPDRIEISSSSENHIKSPEEVQAQIDRARKEFPGLPIEIRTGNSQTMKVA